MGQPGFSRRRSIATGICFCEFLLLIATAQAQRPPLTPPTTAGDQTEVNQADAQISFCHQRPVLVTLLDESRKHLDRQAVAKVHDTAADIDAWQASTPQSELDLCLPHFGDYELEVSAVGYLTGHKDLHILSNLDVRLEMILQKDPAAVELSSADDELPAKARKHVKHAVDALKSANLPEAQKRLDQAYEIAPSSAQVNFLLGYLFLQRNELEKAEDSLNRAATLNNRRIEILTLLGRVQLQRAHLDDARKTLERAVAASAAGNTNEWVAHNLLADVYLRQTEYAKAWEQAQIAIDEGKGAASMAQLTAGQALANLGRYRESIQALQAFLQANPGNPMAPQVRTMIAQINSEELKITEAKITEVKNTEVKTTDISAREAFLAHVESSQTDLLLGASQTSLPLSAWGPPGIDEMKPSVAPGVTCPLDRVVNMSGERVKTFVDSMAQFSAVEDLLHEQLDPTGTPLSRETRKFDYVASITETQPGFLSVDEYRNARYGIYDLPGNIATRGFVTSALVFHPDMRENFEIQCEGLGQWRGQATWLMRFQQREDKPNRLESLRVKAQEFRVNQKGRAWINADTFQIVRIESEMMNPVQMLSVQHQITDYGPVHFQKKNIDLWLPESTDIYLEINRHRYHRRHSFDHYMLFSVDSVEKPKPGNMKKAASDNPSPTL